MRLQKLAVLCALAVPLVADEGMWLFNQFAKDTVKQKYAFAVTDPFLEKLRLASVRIGGGSGSFVSPTGLIATTRRLAAGCIATLGKDSFYAASQSGEMQCRGMEASVLVALEDVTKQVNDGSSATVIARIEKEFLYLPMGMISRNASRLTGQT